MKLDYYGYWCELSVLELSGENYLIYSHKVRRNAALYLLTDDTDICHGLSISQ